MKEKVSCPFTYGAMEDSHRDWCKKIARGHCRDKPCQWRNEKAEVEKPVQCPICHPRLF